jgi:hypothetical protein
MVVVGISLSATSVYAKAAKKAHTLKGSIVSVSGDGSSIVVEGKSHKAKDGTVTPGEKTTVAITSATTIEVDDVGGKHAADLLPGMYAKVSVENGTATDIKARSSKHTKHHSAKIPKKPK